MDIREPASGATSKRRTQQAAGQDTALCPILIVDDHPLFRDALKTAVSSAHLDPITPPKILEAGSLSEARTALAAGPLSLVILDIHLDDNEGFQGLIHIRQTCPDVPVVLCSANQSEDVVKQGIQLGAAGFIPKSSSQKDIAAAIEAVLDGEIWVPDYIDLDAVANAGKANQQKLFASLTPAQNRVLDGVVSGRLNKQIAFDMGISEATVKAHMTSIFRKLGVSNRTQVVLLAQSLNVPKPHEFSA